MARQKTKVFAVFGLGSFGSTVAKVLVEKGGEVIVADSNPEIIDEFKNIVAAAILLDSTDEKSMMKAPLEDVETAIIAIDNMETSIITTALLKKRGIPYILCRAVSDIHAQILQQIGVNEVINLQKDEGKRIATRLIAPEILDTIPITVDTSMAEVYVSTEYINQPVSSMELTSKHSLHLIGIKRIEISVDSEGNPIRREELLFSDSQGPQKDYVPKDYILKAADILVLVGLNTDLEEFKNKL